MDFTTVLCDQFHLQPWQVNNVIQLLDEGNTIPFIARYRKEAHGTLDDQVIRELSERLDYLRNLQKRKEEVGEAIAAQEAMTGELQAALDAAATLAEVEDIYRPYRPKRMTRATKAKERGLEPLAQRIYAQEKDSPYPIDMAAEFVNPEKEVETPEDALSGALDIIAEEISDDAGIRRRLRVIALSQGVVVSRAAKPDEDSVYSQYYDYREPAAKIAGHRVLAIDRGEREEFLKVSLELDQDKAMNIVNSVALKGPSPCYEAVSEAALDAYTRLIFPSVERELRSTLSENAQEAAIKVFSVNLRNLLMQPPVKGKVAMGLDPGYRTGCKVAVVDATGRVLDTGVIYPTHSQSRVQEAKALVSRMIQKYQVEVIAIGNGTASKETEMFTAEVLSNLPQQDKERCAYMVVSEAGASVYSASKLAAEEFPQFDLTLRSAVSIARRLQDPLAELVKIDPKAIGVGQYQHDMPKKRLDEALGGVVEDCVNNVGVDLNTASPSLLERISGLSAAVSKNIVKYREENGAFTSRNELKKVNKLGPKAFVQCAGFLRVPESKNVLDNTGVHPESYGAAKELLKLCGFEEDDVKNGSLSGLADKVAALGEESVAQQIGVGVPTLQDIVKEFLKPGRDPRDELPPPLLRTDILELKDLKPGMELTGTVRNVIDFGAFVDIGVHQDGLVHISQICNKYIKHPSEVLKVGDIVKVWVLNADPVKKRIGLTMKEPKQ
ncbi:Tex-like protein N-terminal domain protein [[Clostridium] leptum DSM 753]|uniref:RNA-binding transcriptional accessory protein n=1 Tax=[Clostridium] leptum DSM 753 TaxID=428125 RepID=A7VYU2_9FIRM|nr:Tex-like protein N-terminal domain protein [[Clostridium] leptum DSM 753]MCC3320791.1 RNA-binding transcriptional accessory protein [[Clostridium] innocuum]PEQ25262.1 RNA-binding transcriptional accessory protein [[Clostridium] leptum DSM 753]